MSETYKPENNQTQSEDPFAQELEWQAESAARRAEGLTYGQPTPPAETKATTPNVNRKSGWGVKAKVTAGVVIGAAVGSGATLAITDRVLPGDKIASATSTIQQGEGVEQSVYRDVAEIESHKIDPADANERQDVVSQAVDINADADGNVFAGENVTVIAEKSPIFGNVTYEAVPNKPEKPELAIPTSTKINEDNK